MQCPWSFVSWRILGDLSAKLEGNNQSGPKESPRNGKPVGGCLRSCWSDQQFLYVFADGLTESVVGNEHLVVPVAD
jgi:hypothetical protein